MTDQAVDFNAVNSKGVQKATFPAKTNNEYRVYIKPEAYEKMKRHASLSDEVELCGVLVGDVYKDDQGIFLKVIGVIEGEGANNYGAQVTFTHDTWSHINETKDREYSSSKIVGWYHTHPGFGVFLSQMDSFIQDNFFSQPYQIAIVLETKKHVEGCFYWVNGKSTPMTRYWVGDSEVRLVTGPADEFSDDMISLSPGASAFQSQRPVVVEQESISPLHIAFMLLLIVTGFLIGKNWGRESERQRMIETEVLSLIEYAARAKMIGLDFDDLESRLSNAEKNLEENKVSVASQEIKNLQSMIASLRKDYTMERYKFREDLIAMASRKQSLSDRVDYNEKKGRELAFYVSSLYLMRLGELLGGVSKFDPSAFSSSRLMEIQEMLNRSIMDFPENKKHIKAIFPGLIEYFYPQDAASTKKGDDVSKIMKN
ncbi:MAG: Mov34/MPN/PAD-1 family protein [Planctomycetes bacterium]|nr:Mov34/MPN/PAD-1 family protein [Planctomycetota bacterium]